MTIVQVKHPIAFVTETDPDGNHIVRAKEVFENPYMNQNETFCTIQTMGDIFLRVPLCNIVAHWEEQTK